MHSSRRFRRRPLAAACVAVMLLGAWSTIAVASPQKKKHLSLTNVVINGTQTVNNALSWVAAGQGFFKQQGLNATLNNSAGSAATDLALLLSGTVQFRTGNSSTTIQAAQNGAPIQALFLDNLDNAQDIVLTQTFATADGVPESGNTPAGALKQLAALKGSHATIGVSNVTSDSYTWAYSLAVIHGLTVGSTPGGTANDINLVLEGSSSATLLTAFQSGKVDGIVNTPPVTVISSPANVTIQLSKIPPAKTAGAAYTFTTTAMIQAHPDTVQAVVNAYYEAMMFARAHPKQAEKDVGTIFATVGITSPEEQQYLYADESPFWTQPFPTKQSYADQVKLVNIASAVPITLPYSTFVNTKFINVTLKKFQGVKF